MTPENFCYWLQGMFELCDPKQLTPEQMKMIKDHLGYVFKHMQGVKAPTAIVTGTGGATPELLKTRAISEGWSTLLDEYTQDSSRVLIC